MPKSSLRVLEILELLASEQRPISHAEIAQRTHIPKSSLTGLLADLVQRRYVIFDADTRRYAPGAQILTLSKGYLERLSISRAGRPALTELINRINENSSLAIRDYDEMVIVDNETCTHPLKQTMVVGSRSPLHCTASGKVLLAFLDEAEREEIVSRIRLPRITRKTITDRMKFRQDLRSVAKIGYAISDEEGLDGVFALAFPVLSGRGVVAALSTAIPISRLTEALKKDVIAALREGSAQISAALGAEPRMPMKSPR